MIDVDFDPKSQRLVFTAGFQYVDVLRSFPSRRFDPKSKKWKAPLVKANYTHLQDMLQAKKYGFRMSPAAIGAMLDFEKLTAGPVYEPYPVSFVPFLKYPPMEHQWPMLDKAWGLDAYGLFAAMGTGKTYTTVALAMARHHANMIDRVAIICPQALHRTWRREFAKYADESKFLVRELETKDKGLDAWIDEEPHKLHVLLISVEGLGISEQMFDKAMTFWKRDGHRVFAVADESSRIKNPKTLRTVRAIELGNASGYRMILNGTPIAKGIQDLWTQYQFLDPNIIGTGDYWAFRSRYVIMGGFENKKIIGYSNVDELMGLLQPYTLEVDKKVLKLQPKTYKVIYVTATQEQRRLFKKIETGEGDGPMIKVQNVLERMLRLQQVIGGSEPMTFEIEHNGETTLETETVPLADNPKIDALMEMIDDNREGTKFIIWARYIPEIELICSKLREKYGADSTVDYYGGTSREDRGAAEDRYCRDAICRFFVGNPAAAGLGLTLISGENDVMVYYSGTFAYIDRAQSEDRAHRIGQTNPVVVVDFVMEDTLDETIQASIREKKDLDQYVKDEMNKGVPVIDLMKGKR